MPLARSRRMKLLYETLAYFGAAAALLGGAFFLVTGLSGDDDRAQASAPASAQAELVTAVAPAEVPAADPARPPVWIVPTAKYDYTPPPPRRPVAQEAKRDNASKRNENSASKRRPARPNARDAIEAAGRSRDAEPQNQPVLSFAPPG